MTAPSVDPLSSDLVAIAVSGPGPAVSITVSGEIDAASAPVLSQRLNDLLDEELRELTIDLAAVTFLDSAGLCVLASAHRRAVHQDVRMRVLVASRAVIRPLQITGLYDLLQVEQVQPVERNAGSAA